MNKHMCVQQRKDAKGEKSKNRTHKPEEKTREKKKKTEQHTDTVKAIEIYVVAS